MNPVVRRLAFVVTVLAGLIVAIPASAQYYPYYYPYNPYAAAQMQQQALAAEMQRRAWLAQQQQLAAEQQRQAWLAQQAQATRWQRDAVVGQQQMNIEYVREYEALWRAAGLGSGVLNMRVRGVMRQLVNFSGKSFTVVPSQTFQWGQAHAGGYILFDISSAAQPLPILAFRLAHEWGHEVHGDQPNIYNPYGGVWRMRTSVTEDEDSADEYAGEFLCTYGYDIDAVKAALQRLPDNTSMGDTHSGGAVRATNVQRGCNRVKHDLDD